VVVARQDRGVDVDRVGDGLAEAVSGERHVGDWLSEVLKFWFEQVGTFSGEILTVPKS